MTKARKKKVTKKAAVKRRPATTDKLGAIEELCAAVAAQQGLTTRRNKTCITLLDEGKNIALLFGSRAKLRLRSRFVDAAESDKAGDKLLKLDGSSDSEVTKKVGTLVARSRKQQPSSMPTKSLKGGK